MSVLRPNRRKGRKRDQEYMEFVRGLPCAVCSLFTSDIRWGLGIYATECAHVGERGLGQKSSDRETIPLCATHHRTGPESHHVLGKRFWDVHGINRDEVIAELQKRYEQPA